MTEEKGTARLAQLRSEAEALAKDYNNAIQNGKYEDAAKANEATIKKVNEYTSIVRNMCFEECKSTKNPMLTAVTMLTFGTIGIEDKQKGEDKVPVRSIIDKERAIDLLKLDKYCGGIGANKNWMHIAQKMNFLLTAQKCVDLGLNPKTVNDSYAMSEIANGFDMGKNPVSKTNLLRTLQMVITAMLGEGYKATSHDVNFLMSVYAKKSRKALTVTCAKHQYFRGYMAEVCHRIVTNASYKVEYKAKKENAVTAIVTNAKVA